MSREADRLAFLASHGLGDASIDALAPDASARRYFRLPESGLLLMDAPPPGEKPADFVRVTDYLERLGARVPRIHAADPRNGFILLEDLGDRTFTRLLDSGQSEDELYRLATEELISLQKNSLVAGFPMELAGYDESATLDEAALFVDWYLPARLGRPTEGSERKEFLALWSRAFADLPALPPVLVHRDFHVDNLLLVGSRCALIDYQDALLGSPVYDLVSLLEDARRDVDPDLRDDLKRHWASCMEMDDAVFGHHYAFWGSQRHCKVAGIFVRLWRRDGKPSYLHHLDRVMALLAGQLEGHRSLGQIHQWMTERLGTIAHGDLENIENPGVNP